MKNSKIIKVRLYTPLFKKEYALVVTRRYINSIGMPEIEKFHMISWEGLKTFEERKPVVARMTRLYKFYKKMFFILYNR